MSVQIRESAVVVAPPAGGAPSLVHGRQAVGKNNSPRTRRVKTYRPCPKLPGRRIRLQAVQDPSKTCLLKCKGWSCVGCGPWMKDRFIKVASQEAKRVFKRGRFLTLTLGPDARDLPTREKFALMTQVWGKFTKRVERLPTHHVKCKKDRPCSKACAEKPCRKATVQVRRKLAAIWVREAHQDGTPHLHVLVDRFMVQAWVSKAWVECGGGPVVDIRAAPISRVVAYITKYLAKSLGKRLPGRSSDGLKGVRRYGTTGEPKLRGIYPQKRGTEPWQIWFKPGLDKPMDWRPVQRGEERYAIAWVTMNFGEGHVLHDAKARAESIKAFMALRKTRAYLTGAAYAGAA